MNLTETAILIVFNVVLLVAFVAFVALVAVAVLRLLSRPRPRLEKMEYYQQLEYYRKMELFLTEWQERLTKIQRDTVNAEKEDLAEMKAEWSKRSPNEPD